MTISANIICDSISPDGIRLTTFVLKYPRLIHSEFMTHRAFSRNASSSRAIPFGKQMKMIEDDTAMPLEFRKNQKGMQAGDSLDQAGQEAAQSLWCDARDMALKFAKQLAEMGVHKQYVNRLVEPFAHISVVVSATEFANFFALRHHSMAQPEIAELARQMWNQYSTNKPSVLKKGEWHLPFISEEEIKTETFASGNINWNRLIKMSVARCARISYLNHDGTSSTYEQDVALYDRLLGSQPIHASPSEHQAECLGKLQGEGCWWGNFHGWKQFRKTLDNENIETFEGPLG